MRRGRGRGREAKYGGTRVRDTFVMFDGSTPPDLRPPSLEIMSRTNSVCLPSMPSVRPSAGEVAGRREGEGSPNLAQCERERPRRRRRRLNRIVRPNEFVPSSASVWSEFCSVAALILFAPRSPRSPFGPSFPSLHFSKSRPRSEAE